MCNLPSVLTLEQVLSCIHTIYEFNVIRYAKETKEKKDNKSKMSTKVSKHPVATTATQHLGRGTEAVTATGTVQNKEKRRSRSLDVPRAKNNSIDDVTGIPSVTAENELFTASVDISVINVNTDMSGTNDKHIPRHHTHVNRSRDDSVVPDTPSLTRSMLSTRQPGRDIDRIQFLGAGTYI